MIGLIPAEFEFINATTEYGSYDPSTNIWTIGNLTNGTYVTLKVYTIAKSTGKQINKTVVVSCDQAELNLTNNVDEKIVDVIDIPSVEKTVSNYAPYYNDTVEYYLTIINSGKAEYTKELTVIDSLPEGLEFIATVDIVGADVISQTINGQSISWVISNISGKSNATITIKVKVNALGELTNNLTVVDFRGQNNTVNCTITPIPIADLEIVKQVSNEIVHKGDKITWTIIVTNHGPNTAVETIVTDKLPAGLIYVDDECSVGEYHSDTGIWNVGDLASGETATLRIVSIADTTNRTIINVAEVTSQTHDPNKTNNRCNNSTDVLPEADLAITVEPNVKEVTVGDKVIYTIKVRNNGPDAAVNTRATIVIPDSLKLLGFKPSKGTYDPDTGIWTIGDLAPGEEATLLLETQALVSGKVVVKASVVSDTYDPDLSNNNDTAEITVSEPAPEDNITEEPPAKVYKPHELPATGNPIAVMLLALIAMAGVVLRRKN